MRHSIYCVMISSVEEENDATKMVKCYSDIVTADELCKKLIKEDVLGKSIFFVEEVQVD